jgi:RNA polymerase sigma-70 factor (ECF subfamily)
MDDATDADPARPAQPADVEAFLRLWEAHRRRVFHYILALLHEVHDAEDVLQETSIVLWRKFREYRDGTNFLAWASKVAHFEVLRHRRKSGKAQLIDEAVLEQLAIDAGQQAHHLDAVREALQGCLGRLSARDRELVSRCYADDERGKDLAASANRPANSVYKSLGRIRRALFECVTRAMRRMGDAAEGGLA